MQKIEGADPISETIMIDQSPIGRTPRSNPVTYIKVFDLIRALFASTRDAEKRGYTAGHFSFNIPGSSLPKHAPGAMGPSLWKCSFWPMSS